MSRATHLQLSDVFLLDDWADVVRRTFSDDDVIGVVLTGSSLVRPDYRDVDVRIVLADAAVGLLDLAVNRDRLHLALSLWGQKATCLPIDCQVQSVSEGNQHDGPVRPLGRARREHSREASA